MPAPLPVAAAERQRCYRRRRAAGLACLQIAVPAELLADLVAAGLIGARADDLDPELEDALVGLLTAFCVTRHGRG